MVALGGALAGAGVGCASQRSTVPAFQTVTIGLCDDYPEESSSAGSIARDMKVLQQANIRHLRVAFGWDGIEVAPDAYDWTLTDTIIAQAEAHGIELIPYVCYTPEWAAGADENVWSQPPKDLAAFEQFMTDIAARYRGRIKTWEIWNEPDNPAYWDGTVRQYGALLLAGSRGVRAGDPEALVVLGGLAWNTDWLAELMSGDPAVARAIDVVNIHNYFETWSPEPIESLHGYIDEVHRIVAEHGEREPIWMAEIGYSSFRRGSFVSDQYAPGYAHEHTAPYQGDAMIRMITECLASGRIDLVAWYRVKDLPADEQVIGDVNNRHLGVVTSAHEPKPALAALARLVELFSQPYRCIDERVTVETTVDDAVHVHVFERRDGTMILIGWLERGEVIERSGRAIDERSATVRVTLPAGRRVEMDLTGPETTILVIPRPDDRDQ